MIVVASANGHVGMDAAWEVLEAGGSALDAVEAGIRVVEDNPDDHSVGVGGYPNVLGQVELDASLMDGERRAVGAVGALRGYRQAITVARAVLERLPHTLVVGDGAARLADELGLEPSELLTPAAEETWRRGVEAAQVDGALGERVHRLIGDVVDPELVASGGDDRAVLERDWLAADDRTREDDRPAPGGTVNVLALDRHGHLASGVSTSGWAWKYPGRLGDSPLAGAGNYCDDRYGAAACTGWGELTVRASTARMVIAGLAAGARLADALRAAFEDLAGLEPGEPGRRGHVSVVALDRFGAHYAASTQADAQYVWRSDGMARAERATRAVIVP